MTSSTLNSSDSALCHCFSSNTITRSEERCSKDYTRACDGNSMQCQAGMSSCCNGSSDSPVTVQKASVLACASIMNLGTLSAMLSSAQANPNGSSNEQPHIRRLRMSSMPSRIPCHPAALCSPPRLSPPSNAASNSFEGISSIPQDTVRRASTADAVSCTAAAGAALAATALLDAAVPPNGVMQQSVSRSTQTGMFEGTAGSRPPQPSLVVFSGGTAFNSVAGHLRRLTTHVTYVLPISDDGGSTAEVVRVLGGPAVGDIRSRCLRLADASDEEGRAVKALLAHRLPAGDTSAAKIEWYQVVEGEHPLWEGVSEPYKHVIRAFLVHFHHQILAHASERFNFSNGSIGNFFFAGARTFFRSLEAAVFLFSRVARIPEGCTVLPAICTEERIVLGAELEDGSIIYGQNNISHPPTGGDVSQVSKTGQAPLPSPIRRIFYLSATSHNTGPLLVPTSPASHHHNSAATSHRSPSPSPVKVGYAAGSPVSVSIHPQPSELSAQAPGLPAGLGVAAGIGGGVGAAGGGGIGVEVLPPAHPTAINHLTKCDAVVYGCGSLYTSICPTICLEGVGEAIASRQCHKILVLNGGHDRETSTCGSHEGPMTAADIVQAVCDSLNRRRSRQGSRLLHPPAAYVTGVLVPQGGEVAVDKQALAVLGVHHVLEVRSQRDVSGHVVYDPHHLVDQIAALLALPLPQQH